MSLWAEPSNEPHKDTVKSTTMTRGIKTTANCLGTVAKGNNAMKADVMNINEF